MPIGATCHHRRLWSPLSCAVCDRSPRALAQMQTIAVERLPAPLFSGRRLPGDTQVFQAFRTGHVKRPN